MAAVAQMRDVDVSWSTRLTIGGREVEGEGAQLAVENPATEKTLTTFRQASLGQLDEAVRAARSAFESGAWSNAAQRRQVLLRFADLIEAHKEELGAALVQEVGTPIMLVPPLQIGAPLAMLRYFADKAIVDRTRRLGPDKTSPLPSESLIRYVPVGVVAAITAYNYPLLLAAAKIGPALAAGCTVVLLPSPQAPLATLLLGKLLREAGFPDGVVNIIVGGAEIGRALSEHPGVDKITFTGSVAVGSAVMQQAAKTVKGVVLELGGKSAAIILPSADLKAVAGPVHLRYLRNAGQGCGSPTRILVHERQLDEFIALSKPVFASVKVGDPWDPTTLSGPLITAAHRARVEGFVERAVASGGRVVAGGGRPPLERGWYMNPTLVTGLRNDHELCQHELFGPVGIVLPYRDIDEAVAIANDSYLGLAGSVFGPTEEARPVAERMRVGTVTINGGGGLRLDAPMGGFKQSGIGREWGEEGVLEFLELQHIQWALA